MSNRVIQGRHQLLKNTESEWLKLKYTFIPLDGELCVTVDDDGAVKALKIGDGTHAWGELNYANTSSEFDEKSLTETENGVQLVGFDSATTSQSVRKGSDGRLEWYTPVGTLNSIYLGDTTTKLEPTSEAPDSLIIPKATVGTLGVVKGSDEIKVDTDGSISVNKIPASKVDGLKDALVAISDLATANMNPKQMTITGGTLTIVNLDASVITRSDGTTVEDVMNSVDETNSTVTTLSNTLSSDINDTKDALTWKEF